MQVYRDTYPPERRQTFCTSFSHNRGSVVFDGTLTDVQISRDIFTGCSDEHEFQYFVLARRERSNIHGSLPLLRNNSLQLLIFLRHLLVLSMKHLQLCQRGAKLFYWTHFGCAFVRPLVKELLAF